ncbi:MAG: DNA primase [Dehalococcoidia bacterium]|nr:DNA primase [Dehalococcoidia bacterium]
MSNVDDIKQKLDIVEVVSGYLPLQKAGRNFRASCPFHSEKTPSFFVFPERQTWHCFGCGAGGDAFLFVMKKEGIGFGETLKMLAERTGVALAPREGAEQRDREALRLSEMNQAAAAYYHHLLLNSKAAEQARKYLEKRGVSEKAIADFELGYSLDSWDGLRQHMVSAGYQEPELVSGGLLKPREDGSGNYDRFRNRLMFPIRDIKGRVVGFGGRSLDGSEPKYLNSPQTLLFDKSGILYGIDKARAAIRERDQAIIVEGYMDALMAHQYGIANVVASMGTALTPRQITILKGFTSNLALALDADAAGAEATLRGLEVQRNTLDRKKPENPYQGQSDSLPDLRIIELPQGKDPDEIIKENPEAWGKLVAGAAPLVDYIFRNTLSKFDLSSDEGKAAAAQKLLPYVSEERDEIRRVLYRGKLARLVGISERALAETAARLKPTMGEKRRGIQPAVPQADGGDRLEEYCLALLLQRPALRKDAEDKITAELFERTDNREMFRLWREANSPEWLRANADPTLHPHLDRMLAIILSHEQAEESKDRKTLADCVRRLRQRRLQRLKAQEEELLSEAEQTGNPGELAQLCYTLWRSKGGEAEVEPDLARLAALQRAGVELNKELHHLFQAGARKKGRT